MKVSVIVPVYNAEKYLPKCIDSLINQTFQDIEIILINDGSQDSSGEICNSYKNKDSRIVVIHQTNQGASSARNKGLDHAKGYWILSVDADDWLELDMIEKLYESAITNDAEIVACGAIKETNHGVFKLLYDYGPVEDNYNKSKISIIHCALWNKLIKRELYDRAKVRSEEGITMWDDHFVTSKLRYHSKKTVIIPDTLYHYRWMGQSSITTRNAYKFPVSEIKVAELIDGYYKAYIKEGDKIAKAIVINTKFASKLPLLTPNTKSKETWLSYEGEKGIKLWRSIFPELHKTPNVISFISGKKSKIKAWMALYLPIWLTSCVFYIAVRILEILRLR